MNARELLFLLHFPCDQCKGEGREVLDRNGWGLVRLA
jgi:hypothetical protein